MLRSGRHAAILEIISKRRFRFENSSESCVIIEIIMRIFIYVRPQISTISIIIYSDLKVLEIQS